MRSERINRKYCQVMEVGVGFHKKDKSGDLPQENDIKWSKKGEKSRKLLKKTKKVDILKQMCYSLAKLVVFDTPG